MDVQASHLLGSNARCVFPNDCHQVKQRNLQISNIRINISLTTFWNHGIQFRNLVEHNVPQPENALFMACYSSQSGAAHGSRAFNIQRGVKQVDILSPMFFNVVLECACVLCGNGRKIPTLWHSHGSSRMEDKCQVCGWFDVICPFLACSTWPWGSTSSQDNRLGKIQPTSAHAYKLTHEIEIEIEVPPSRCRRVCQAHIEYQCFVP